MTVPSSAVQRTVAVIGAGSAGIISAIELLRRGHHPTIFETGSGYAGIWASNPANAVVYPSLRTNLPKVVMQLDDFDFPEELPSYLNKEQLGDYIVQLAVKNNLKGHTRFNTTVSKVRWTGMDLQDLSGKWQVTWADKNEAQKNSKIFDAVVVATGHYNEPHRPEIPGQIEWQEADSSRRVIHAADFEDETPFVGSSVLIVGGRASGADIARSVRDVATRLVCLDKGCGNEPFIQDHCTRVPIGSSLRPDGGMNDPNGNEILLGGVGPIDTIILATGYLYDFPFLNEKELGMTFKKKRFVEPLYQHLMHTLQPKLGFVGIPLSIPWPMPFFASQARFLAAYWAISDQVLSDTTPTLDERQKWLEERKVEIGERSQDLHLMTVGVGAFGYMAELDSATVAFTSLAHGDGSSAGSQEIAAAKARLSRLSTVQEIYKDRVQRQSKIPWGSDLYRDCEYAVDWYSQQWSVAEPKKVSANRGNALELE